MTGKKKRRIPIVVIDDCELNVNWLRYVSSKRKKGKVKK